MGLGGVLFWRAVCFVAIYNHGMVSRVTAAGM